MFSRDGGVGKGRKSLQLVVVVVVDVSMFVCRMVGLELLVRESPPAIEVPPEDVMIPSSAVSLSLVVVLVVVVGVIIVRLPTAAGVCPSEEERTGRTPETCDDRGRSTTVNLRFTSRVFGRVHCVSEVG